MSTQTIEPETITGEITDVEIVPYEDSDDPERRTHLVRGIDNGYPEGFPSQDVVDLARLAETEVVALCGYTWVPKHNPDKYPACQRCFEVAASLMGS